MRELTIAIPVRNDGVKVDLLNLGTERPLTASKEVLLDDPLPSVLRPRPFDSAGRVTCAVETVQWDDLNWLP